VKFARDHGVKIAIENCPMIFSYDEWPGGNNLASTPAIWRKMWEIIPDDNLGLNLDPSHLILQMIDYERVIREFSDRIFHVHAKDLHIDREGLYNNGVLSQGMGWQVPRLPGLGDMDWAKFFAALTAARYDYVVSIEHEDRVFEGDEELVKRGFYLSRDVLKPFIH
jgi:sugar phosphate isomerase/epimerase